MPRSTTTLVALSVSLLLAAGLAWASTEAELEGKATRLLIDYDDVDEDITACQQCTHSEKATLLLELDALGAELARLHADRDGLQGCGCQVVNVLLSELDQWDERLWVQVENWDIGS